MFGLYITHWLYLELCAGTCMVFIVCSVDLVSFWKALCLTHAVTHILQLKLSTKALA